MRKAKETEIDLYNFAYDADRPRRILICFFKYFIHLEITFSNPSTIIIIGIGIAAIASSRNVSSLNKNLSFVFGDFIFLSSKFSFSLKLIFNFYLPRYFKSFRCKLVNMK